MVNKSVLITGIAGTGKSSVCKGLKILRYKAYDIEDMNGLFVMIDKKTKKIAKNYDNNNIKSVKQHDWICDKKRLQYLIKNNSKGIVFYCGIASNLDDFISMFDIVFLLKVNSKTICKRLSSRKLGEFGNTVEVQKYILVWKDQWENHIYKKGAIKINANNNIQKVISDILTKIESLIKY